MVLNKLILEQQPAAEADAPVVPTSLPAELPSPRPARTFGSPSDPNHAGYVPPTEILPHPENQQPTNQRQES